MVSEHSDIPAESGRSSDVEVEVSHLMPCSCIPVINAHLYSLVVTPLPSFHGER